MPLITPCLKRDWSPKSHGIVSVPTKFEEQEEGKKRFQDSCENTHTCTCVLLSTDQKNGPLYKSPWKLIRFVSTKANSLSVKAFHTCPTQAVLTTPSPCTVYCAAVSLSCQPLNN
ncbi:hypothetical protein KIL84_021021 [Mauremys mutica]|uniref:Uncharacterized protein n=1 Tax=Mauremys mutica TaxID=74926 RepID=A0A9D3XA72_9SAUR|nr:hypothetical protein KIL84_021021 [Mauremys mutica]